MPDNKQKRGRADRERVNVVEGYEVRYWCDKFDCSERELRDAVEEVGPMAKKVEAYLEAKREA
jgi:hypothetical protein